LDERSGRAVILRAMGRHTDVALVPRDLDLANVRATLSRFIDLLEIEVFLVLAGELHFGRTGDRLGLTSSRISQVVRSLETRLGGALFERTSRRVRLTPLGEMLRQLIAPAYETLEAAITEARDAAQGVAGTLRLGMYTPINGGPHLVEIIKTFEAHHAACRVEIVDTGLITDQLDWLRRGAVDLLATRLPIDHPDVTVGPILSREDRVLVVAADHPLSRRTSVSIEDLADYTFPYVTGLPPETMDAFIPPTTPSGRRFARRTARSISEALTNVARGETVQLTVASFLHHHRHPGVTVIPLTGLPLSETALVWLTKHGNARIEALVETASIVLDTHPTRTC
jgi:DNA-binding transcriptional LysR family regulator